MNVHDSMKRIDLKKEGCTGSFLFEYARRICLYGTERRNEERCS